MKKTEQLPKRVLRIVDRCRAGEVLCKTLIHGADGRDVVLFLLHPSNKPVRPKSSEEAIASGLLVAQRDGLFGPDTSQTWRAD